MVSVLQQKIILALFVFLALVPAAAPAQTSRPTDDVFHLSVARGNDGAIELTWKILPGHYLYRERISARTDDGTILPVTTDVGETKEDPTFGTTEVYHGKARASLAANDLPPSGTLRVAYQGCAEHGICYPPVAKTIDLATLAVAAVKRDGIGGSAVAGFGVPATESAKADDGLSAKLSGSLPTMLMTFLGFGLLLALTPCVFPMIPILSGMLARSGERLSAGRGFLLSGAYVLAMALAYAALGVVAAWSGQNLQLALQTPVALGLMSLVFVALALSMFGLYDLELPAAWTTRLSRGTIGRSGSIGGAALLGFGSALIVGPCVTPPLAAALLYVAQTGDVARGAAALFALGLGMGLPLLVFGAFGSGLLPKAGLWLVKVKQAFGFIFLGLAIWMLGRMLPGEATLALWGALATACGIWLGALDLIRHRGGQAGRKSLTIAGSVAALYGMLLLVAAAFGASDPLRLPAFFDRPETSATTDSGFIRNVSTPAAFDEAMAAARAEGRPILVDFTADWCIVCREIDNAVMANPNIRSRLKNVSIIRADITADSGDSHLLMRRFGVVGPPTMLFVDTHTGLEIEDTRTIGAISADQFSRKLDRAGV
jgi:thiol:disulfide interchange protein DsbD